ncbi:hypothetical protein [Paraburkholderia heleia]|uniref:hypothetical protein n=1 Tax=Paraburkholderia heleia TaxID=634127 RepID=UPI002AB71305|nr:hypothetical protein [Paraburkholderia heleia]
MSTTMSTHIKDERIQRLLQGTVPGERYRTVEFQQRTGWTSATTRVVIGYAMKLGLV